MNQTSETLLHHVYVGLKYSEICEHCEQVEIGDDGGRHHKTATKLAKVAVWTVGNWSRSLDIQKTMEVLCCPEYGLFET